MAGLLRNHIRLNWLRAEYLGILSLMLKQAIFLTLARLGFNTPSYYRMLAIKNRFCGKSAFIIGNGPSLRFEDLDQLQTFPTFASNKIFLAFKNTEWRPDFYAAMDRNINEDVNRFIEDYPETTTFIPQYFQSPRLRHVIQFTLTGEAPEEAPPDFFGSIDKGICGGATVSYVLMQIAFHLGFQTIYLLGMDMDYKVYGQQIETDALGNRYMRKTKEENYFIKDYHKEGEQFSVVNPGGQLWSMVAAQKHYKAAGRSIINVTRGGKLDLFPRKDFEEILEIENASS